MKSVEMRTLVDQYIEAYNRMDVAAMLETLHPDVAFKNIAGGTVSASTSGLAEFKALAQQSLPLFSERQQTVLSFEANEAQAVVAIGFRAVVANDLPNGLRQGQVLSLTGRSEFEFRDGAIFGIVDVS